MMVTVICSLHFSINCMIHKKSSSASPKGCRPLDIRIYTTLQSDPKTIRVSKSAVTKMFVYLLSRMYRRTALLRSIELVRLSAGRQQMTMPTSALFSLSAEMLHLWQCMAVYFFLYWHLCMWTCARTAFAYTYSVRLWVPVRRCAAHLWGVLTASAMIATPQRLTTVSDRVYSVGTN